MFELFRKRNHPKPEIHSNLNYFGSDTAVVVEAIYGPHSVGRIRCKGGVIWSGICDQSLTLVPGQRVQLLRRTGNTWSVRPF